MKLWWIVWVNGPFPAGQWPDLCIAWKMVSCMWHMEATMMETSGHQHLQDTTTRNTGPMDWLGHVIRLSTGASSALGACQ